MRDEAHRDDPARLSDLAPAVAATVVRVAGDVALVIGEDGVIRNVADGRQLLARRAHDWVGMRWADTVSQSARGRAETLLREAREHGVSRRSELNHPGAEGAEIPFSWAAVRLGEGGPLLAVGRDLRAVTAIQQRFQETQLSLERSYWQRRLNEGQHRQLHQVVHDAVLLLDGASGLVLEANAAAAALFGHVGPDWAGVTLAGLVEEGQRGLLADWLQQDGTRREGAAGLRLRSARQDAWLELTATQQQSAGTRALLLRARQTEPEAAAAAQDDVAAVLDSSGRVLCANPAFVALCRADDDAQLRGRTPAALLGDSEGWAVLLARVRDRGIAEGVSLRLQPPHANPVLASASASALAEGDQQRVGLVLRPVRDAATAPAPALPADLDSLLLRVGQAPLAVLLADAARLAEARIIEAALRQAQGRPDAAARALQIGEAELQRRLRALGLAGG